MPIIPPPQPGGQQAPAVDSRALEQLERRFTKLFAIEQLVDVPDGQGGFTRTWGVLDTVPGALQQLSAEERLARGLTDATGTYTAFIGYRTDVNVKARLNMSGRIFDIAGISDLGEQNVMLALDVKERFRA